MPLFARAQRKPDTHPERADEVVREQLALRSAVQQERLHQTARVRPQLLNQLRQVERHLHASLLAQEKQ